VQAYRAALAAEASEFRFVQWLRGVGLLNAHTYATLEKRCKLCPRMTKFQRMRRHI